jgi:hypothetical protein
VVNLGQSWVATARGLLATPSFLRSSQSSSQSSTFQKFTHILPSPIAFKLQDASAEPRGTAFATCMHRPCTSLRVFHSDWAGTTGCSGTCTSRVRVSSTSTLHSQFHSSSSTHSQKRHDFLLLDLFLRMEPWNPNVNPNEVRLSNYGVLEPVQAEIKSVMV